jgi:signal transduction histidine kinase
VFERFFRASAAVDLHLQGVGLGLAIVKRIIDGHDGSITVASELGVGTTFRIVLPAPSAADVDILSAAVPVGSH